jgi:uncharacterized protein YndB with AHSA1/START domain/DNA-binding transcriptional ArsR family regulator
VTHDDAVFKALADPVRRTLLDRLREKNGQTLSELGEGLGMTRQAVTKHIAILEAANLVAFERRGRERLHFLNPIPIQEVADRWIGAYQRGPAAALTLLKRSLEGESQVKDRFVYVIYIMSTPQKIWGALTDAALNRQFWFGMHQQSDFRVGSPWSIVGEDGKVWDKGSIVEADPPNKLVIAWTHQQRPELTAEGESRCTIVLDEAQGSTKLTLTHEIDVENSQFIQAVSNGWPAILSALKTLLESQNQMARP